MEDACARLSPTLEDVGGALLVNDRVDVACAGAAHGAQVGHRSLTPAAARAALGFLELLVLRDQAATHRLECDLQGAKLAARTRRRQLAAKLPPAEPPCVGDQATERTE